MSVNRIVVSAPPETVFSMLSDAHRYADWVVGAKRIRDADSHWPDVGARFFHSLGVGPLTLHDETEVVESERDRLVLHARVRPLFTASVTVSVAPSGAGTEVTMEEHPVAPSWLRALTPALDPLTSRRNNAALHRLKQLVEQGG